MPVQKYTISHTGSVLEDAGEDAVDRHTNQVDPQRQTEVLSFECPQNFDTVSWVGRRDPVRFRPRTKETFDGDGGTTEFTLDARILPVAGEEDLGDQPYPAVEAVADGSQVDIEDVDYATGTVTLASAPSTGTGNVHIFPIITEGTLIMRGINALGHNEGPVYPWPFPLYRWHDMEQDKRGTEVNLNGAIAWDRNETMEVLVDSPRELVWEDADYPGAYVSLFEMDVEISF